MENLQAEKKEALAAAAEYMEKLIPGMGTLCEELRGSRKEDTDTFQKQCIDGLNWIIEIYNRTSDILNAEKISEGKKALNDNLLELGSAIANHEDSRIADLLEKAVIPFLKELSEEAKEAVK